jgi:hypothetical protein
LALIAAVLVAQTLAATPSYTVAITRRVGLTPDGAMDMAEMLSVELQRQGVPGKVVSPRAFATSLAAAKSPDPESCAGAVDCAAVLGRNSGVDWVFAIQIAKVAGNVIFDVSLVRSRDGAELATSNRSVSYKKPVLGVVGLAKDLAHKSDPMKEAPPPPPPPPTVAQTEPPQPALAPVIVTPSDKPVTTGGEVKTSSGMTTGRYVAIGLGVVAVGAVGTGAYLGVSASSQANNLSSRAANYQDAKNQVLNTARTADIAYGAAALCAAAAVVVWILASPSHSPNVGAASTPAGWDTASPFRIEF